MRHAWSYIICMLPAVFLLSAPGMAADATLVQASPGRKIAYVNPVWSPDGRSIAYVAVPYQGRPVEPTVDQAGKSIHLATLSGGTWRHRVLVSSADWPVWSPDGTRLAFNQKGLMVMDIGTGKARRLVADKEENAGGEVETNYPLKWSPGGRYLLYERAFYEGSKGYVYDLAAGKTLGTRVGTDAHWLSEGRLLSAETEYGYPELQEAGAWLMISNLAQNKTRTLITGRRVHSPFAPGGANYAWIHGADMTAGEGIYRIDLRTGALAKQVSVDAYQWYWSPDGKRFAFLAAYSSKAGDQPAYNMYAGITRNWYFTAAARNVAEPSHNWHDRMKYAGWSPDGTQIAYVTAAGDIRITKPQTPGPAVQPTN